MRRAASALVETRVESFESLHPLEASKARLGRALAELPAPRTFELTGAWTERDGRAVYEATFAPGRRTRRFLHATSLVLALLIGSCVWVFHAAPPGAPSRFLLPFFTFLAVVAMPFAVNAAASQRQAEEARIARAVRIALRDESPEYPPPQRWPDED